MKLVIAYIRPDKLNDVKRALFEKDIKKLSVTNSLGCGQQGGFHENYRGVELEVSLHKKIRLEIGVNDDFVKPTCDAIIESAKTGSIGDGKIFILPIEECIRIRTDETGNDAIG